MVLASKAPIPPNCDAIEALLRLELLTQFPNWLTQKATMLGCTSSHDILKMALKEIFPNEDATRFDLVEDCEAAGLLEAPKPRKNQSRRKIGQK